MANRTVASYLDSPAPNAGEGLVWSGSDWVSTNVATQAELDAVAAAKQDVLTAGAGLTKTGATVDVGAGSGISVAADSVAADFGTGSGKVTQGNDSRLTDSRAPNGSAGGDLTGTYPSPTLANAGGGAAGPTGARNVIPVVTVDAKGRVSALSSAGVRDVDLATALGIIADSGPPVGGAVQTSQAVNFGAVYLYAGESIANIIVCVTTAGSGTAPTSLKLGLWSSAATPVCLAVTADLASDSRWTSAGQKVCALTGAYSVVTSGIYYPCFWINGTFASTNVQIMTIVASGQFGGQIGSGARRSGALKTGATTMAVADTGTYALAGNSPWLAVS